MLESLTVDAYGEPTPLQHLGSVAARDAQTASCFCTIRPCEAR